MRADASNRAEIKKAAPIEIGTATYCQLPVLALRLRCSRVVFAAVRAAFVAIVSDNSLAK
jgi:hypothetical protein